VRLLDTTPTPHPIRGPGQKPAKADDEQRQVSRGIEAMFMRQMLEASHLFDGIGGHPMMQGMMLEGLADSVVAGGSLGIGDQIATPASKKSPEVGIGSADELSLLRPRRADTIGDSFGAEWSINLESISLPDDLLPSAAQQALAEGRVSGLEQGGSVEMALQRSWKPVIGQPTGETGVIPLAQAASHAVLGEGPKTIRQVGCLLTSLTMVSNTITQTRRTVEEANDVVTAAGGFRGVDMRFGPASETLGLRTTARGAFDGNTQPIDRALLGGKPVIAGVDFKEGSSSSLGGTDHFLVLTGRTTDGGYTAIDAANGKSLTFTRDDSGALRAGRYRLSEFITLEPRSSGPTT
jgi:hypothetical protein